VFVTVSHFHPCLIYEDKAGAFPSGVLFALLQKLGHCESVTNKLAYYATELFTAVKCFTMQAPVVKVIKLLCLSLTEI
jgi:hypothetical protein